MRGKTCFSCELERATDSNVPMVFWRWKLAAFVQFLEDITISATDFNTRSHAFNLVVDQYVGFGHRHSCDVSFIAKQVLR